METQFEAAQREVNEHMDTRTLDVQILREKIQIRPDILFARTDEEFLIRFLRARKYDKDKAFQLLVNYNQFRRKHITFFKSLNASYLRPVFEDGLPMVSPVRDHLGRTLVFLLAGCWNTKLYTFEDILRALLLTVEYLVESERTQLFGFVLVIDFTGWKFNDVHLLKKQHLVDAVNVFQDCFPGRFKSIHFLNQPWYVRALLTFVKPMLKEKAYKRIYFHGKDMFALQRFIHGDVVPRELGGNYTIVDKSWLYNALLEREVKYGKRNKNWLINPC